MDAGLSNLLTLKQHLLRDEDILDIVWDDAVARIGLGVADALNKHCNRLFQRSAGDTYITTADRVQLWLPRAPVETVTSVHLQEDATDGWEAQDSTVIANQDLTSGWIYFGYALGDYSALIKVTYTGGYYYDTTEDGTGTQPSAATAVPDDLKLAWLLQCEHIWSMRDKLGITVGDAPGKQSAVDQLQLIPEVRRILQGYIRYAIA